MIYAEADKEFEEIVPGLLGKGTGQNGLEDEAGAEETLELP